MRFYLKKSLVCFLSPDDCFVIQFNQFNKRKGCMFLYESCKSKNRERVYYIFVNNEIHQELSMISILSLSNGY